jgi:ABC-type nitrate/sulfonate/bicarbonate transport system permease component
MVRNVPHLAMIPLVILWFGIGESAKLFLIVIGVFFPIYINTLHGIRSVDPRLIEMGRVYGLSSFELFQKIILPGALPSILVGVRYALGVMWLTLIVAETIASDNGIGFMTMNARVPSNRRRTSRDHALCAAGKTSGHFNAPAGAVAAPVESYLQVIGGSDDCSRGI